jgi:hypothetical protein
MSRSIDDVTGEFAEEMENEILPSLIYDSEITEAVRERSSREVSEPLGNSIQLNGYSAAATSCVCCIGIVHLLASSSIVSPRCKFVQHIAKLKRQKHAKKEHDRNMLPHQCKVDVDFSENMDYFKRNKQNQLDHWSNA